jgi:hypothetical protein
LARFYVGYHLGGALDLVDIADPFGPSLFGDTVRTPGPLAGGQVGYNCQRGAALVGFEADVSWADMDGTNICFALSNYYVSANCRAKIDALGTFAGRLGGNRRRRPRVGLGGRRRCGARRHLPLDGEGRVRFPLGRALCVRMGAIP